MSLEFILATLAVGLLLLALIYGPQLLRMRKSRPGDQSGQSVPSPATRPATSVPPPSSDGQYMWSKHDPTKDANDLGVRHSVLDFISSLNIDSSDHGMITAARLAEDLADMFDQAFIDGNASAAADLAAALHQQMMTLGQRSVARRGLYQNEHTAPSKYPLA